MEKENIPYFCEDLNSYLKKTFKYKKNYSHAVDANISAFARKFDIYLRWNGVYFSKNFPKNLTIARIGFYKKRQGYGKAFLDFLIECSFKYQFDYLIIEATNEKSASFAHKFGFQKIDDEDGRNFVISINDLRIIMSSM
ncbi:MAG: hypothetical protein PHO27_07650 [Sulfuricurvum sp.]|nr:hypothetical protein [Sulfuricurvum sp.]